LKKGIYSCYWSKSGTMETVKSLLNDERRATLADLLGGEKLSVPMESRISLEELTGQKSRDKSFYSLLVQCGYLSLVEKQGMDAATVSIPNKELMHIWKSFILDSFYEDAPQIRTLFDNINSPQAFSDDLEYFLSDRLSYHDLGTYEGIARKRVHERAYHLYLLGILSAYDDITAKKPLSNREPGDGRYDIMVEKPDVCIIFELKSCEEGEDPQKAADSALAQIETKRYGTDIGQGKKLIKAGIGFSGKRCKVAVGYV